MLLKWPPKTILNCQACHLSQSRKNVVVGRGVGNYKGGLLFIGEAPGQVEDALGEPFVGPSGNILDKLLKLADIDNYYITNTILCRSFDPTTDKNRAPFPPEVMACSKNIESILLHVIPSVVCFIGKTSERFYKNKVGVKTFQVIHPAAILSVGGEGSFAFREALKKYQLIKEVMSENKLAC